MNLYIFFINHFLEHYWYHLASRQRGEEKREGGMEGGREEGGKGGREGGKSLHFSALRVLLPKVGISYLCHGGVKAGRHRTEGSDPENKLRIVTTLQHTPAVPPTRPTAY